MNGIDSTSGQHIAYVPRDTTCGCGVSLFFRFVFSSFRAFVIQPDLARPAAHRFLPGFIEVERESKMRFAKSSCNPHGHSTAIIVNHVLPIERKVEHSLEIRHVPAHWHGECDLITDRGCRDRWPL